MNPTTARAPQRRRQQRQQAWCLVLLVLLVVGSTSVFCDSAHAFTFATVACHRAPAAASKAIISSRIMLGSSTTDETTESATTIQLLFDDLVEFLKRQQEAIIAEIEGSIELSSGAKFSKDTWGVFASDTVTDATTKSGGITRVLQGGSTVEKGACSLTLIRDGVLTADRAATIRARQESDVTIQAGDTYSAAALSIVLHSRSPMVPTFRSDVRVFLVTAANGSSWAWFGGGADLTPYYLFPDDIRYFHGLYQTLCSDHVLGKQFSYEAMKGACDQYFYLPARQEHRGTGGIFFDDIKVTLDTLQFVKSVSSTWMPSWLPIVAKRQQTPFTASQKQWQKLRRGRYLEFNLLYDVR